MKDMQSQLATWAMASTLVWFAGCQPAAPTGTSTETPPATAGGDHDDHDHGDQGHAHGHSHTGDDALVWEGDPVEHGGTIIQLGHHGAHLHAGAEVEPAVSIIRDGQPVADAKVFNSLVTTDGATVLAAEVPTIYEPTTAEEPAHYAQGGLMIPADAKGVAIRFRIELPGGESKTFDVPVKLE